MVAMLGEFGLAVCLVVTFVVMFWKMWNMQREDNNRREERDRETITHLSEIMSTNSRALLKNSETMEKINEKIDNMSLIRLINYELCVKFCHKKSMKKVF